jgi:hypothetical protein
MPAQRQGARSGVDRDAGAGQPHDLHAAVHAPAAADAVAVRARLPAGAGPAGPAAHPAHVGVLCVGDEADLARRPTVAREAAYPRAGWRADRSRHRSAGRPRAALRGARAPRGRADTDPPPSTRRRHPLPFDHPEWSSSWRWTRPLPALRLTGALTYSTVSCSSGREALAGQGGVAAPVPASGLAVVLSGPVAIAERGGDDGCWCLQDELAQR